MVWHLCLYRLAFETPKFLAFETPHEAHILVFDVSNAKYLAFDTPDENALRRLNGRIRRSKQQLVKEKAIETYLNVKTMLLMKIIKYQRGMQKYKYKYN